MRAYFLSFWSNLLSNSSWSWRRRCGMRGSSCCCCSELNEMKWNYWSLWPTQLLSPKSSSHNLIYILSELISQKCLDSKRQYIYSKPRKGGGWALGNWRASQKNNGHPATPYQPSATPYQPSATPSESSATPSMATPSTPSTPCVSYKYKGHPGGDIHSPVSPFCSSSPKSASSPSMHKWFIDNSSLFPH